MRNWTTSFQLKLINYLLVTLGFSACVTGCYGGDEYGSPSARYKVRGTTVDQTTKKPIKGLQAVVYDRWNDDLHGIDTLYTDNKGEFNFYFQTFPAKELYLKIEDVDGEDNGMYAEKDITLDFTDAKYVGGGTWYKGETSKDVGNIEMSEPEEIIEEE